MRHRLEFLIVIVALITICFTNSSAETRIYSQILLKTSGTTSDTKPTFSLFLRQENRFRKSGLVLNKVFIGGVYGFSKIFSFRGYYAFKDLLYKGHFTKNMLVGDIIAKYRWGRYSFLDKNGNEWHITDKFYRYRNYFQISCLTPLNRLKLWTADEIRFDSDQKRINMNDVRLGLCFTIRKNLTFSPFFDLESKRRNKQQWEDTPFLGLFVSSSF